MLPIGIEPPLRLAATVGLVALGLSLLMALQVVLMRLGALRQARRHGAAVARWRPLFARIAVGNDSAQPLPPLQRTQRRIVLVLWVQMQESLRGDAHARLNRLGLQLGLHTLARRMAASPRMTSRVLGFAALGHFAHPGDRPLIERAMQERDRPSSLVAARALLRMDAGSAETVLDRYLVHDDWPVPRMGSLLREAPPRSFAAALVARLLQGSLYAQLRLLPLLRLADVADLDGVVARLVRSSAHPQVLSVVLRMLQSPALLPEVRAFARHADPLVRSAAAQALSRLGADEDHPLILELMADPNWWVRYRAAQALLALPRTGEEDILQVLNLIVDRYARDALRQVLAERALTVTPDPAAA